MSRSTSTVELNLFPFLSVLVAVIGILILNLVSVISTRVIGLKQGDGTQTPGSDEETLDETQFRDLENQIRQLGSQLVKNRAECGELERTVRELEARVAAQAVEETLGWTGPEDAFAGLALDAPVEVQAVPDPMRADRRIPIPVEVAAEGYVVRHPNKTEQLPSLTQDPKPMRQFLQQVDTERDQRYLLVLVRPNGVANYKLLRGLLDSEFGHVVDVEQVKRRASRIAVGVEPLDRNWLLLPGTQ
jgi:hypothetical protein